MGEIDNGGSWMYIYLQSDFILKLFTNHLFLYFLYIQVIINQSWPNQKYHFVWHAGNIISETVIAAVSDTSTGQ